MTMLHNKLQKSKITSYETAVITKILGKLPPEYRSLRKGWMSLDPKQQNINNITAQLIDEEASIPCEEDQDMALVVFTSQTKKNPTKNEPSTSRNN